MRRKRDSYSIKAAAQKRLVANFNNNVAKVERALSKLEDDLLPGQPLAEVATIRERKLISDARRSIRGVRNREHALNRRR